MRREEKENEEGDRDRGNGSVRWKGMKRIMELHNRRGVIMRK